MHEGLYHFWNRFGSGLFLIFWWLYIHFKVSLEKKAVGDRFTHIHSAFNNSGSVTSYATHTDLGRGGWHSWSFFNIRNTCLVSQKAWHNHMFAGKSPRDWHWRNTVSFLQRTRQSLEDSWEVTESYYSGSTALEHLECQKGQEEHSGCTQGIHG